MNFVNNYLEPITLAQGATSVTLNLPDGEYVLTLADSTTPPTRHEIVHATVTGGMAVLSRAQEGTLDQAWDQGSVIYCGVTAETLEKIGQGVEGPGAGWGRIGEAANYTGGLVTHTLSPSETALGIGSGGAGYDVELVVPSSMPVGTALRLPASVSMFWGSALRVRTPAPIFLATVTEGAALASLQDGGAVLHLLFDAGEGYQTALNMVLLIERAPIGFLISCELRERLAEAVLGAPPVQ